MKGFWDDIRFALRLHRKSWLVALPVIVLLALGIGVNLSVFTIFNSVILRPMPGIRDAGGLTMIGRTFKGRFSSTSLPEYRDFRDQNQVFSSVAAVDETAISFSSGGYTERLMGELVSSNYFETIGVRIAHGRGFLAGEDRTPGQAPVAVIGDRLWNERWNRDPSVLGTTIMLNNHAFIIVGVAEPAFRGAFLPTAMDLWVPISMQALMQPGFDLMDNRGFSWMRILARRKAGVSLKQAADNVSALSTEMRKVHPGIYAERGHAVAAYSSVGAPSNQKEIAMFLAILLGVSFLTLIVVCANVANLLLAKAATRRREIAIRLAIGAGRFRVLRQMVTEGLVLAVAGSLAGALLAAWGADVLYSFIPGDEGYPLALDIAPDWRILAFAAALAWLSCLAFALPAAWETARPALLPALKDGERAVSPRRSRLRLSLSVVQVAMCVLLLSGAALLARSLHLLRGIDIRVRANEILLVGLDPALNGYTQESSKLLYSRIQDRVRTLPGVEAAGFARTVPFTGSFVNLFLIYGGVIGRQEALSPQMNVIGTDYFRATGIQVLRGREFEDRDRNHREASAVVNETLAQRLWPDQDPVGRSLHVADENAAFEVIGVVRDAPYSSPDQQPEPVLYLSFYQMERFNLRQTLHVRVRSNPMGVYPLVRRAVSEIDPNLPLFQVRAMAAVVEESLFTRRFASMLVSFAAAMSILIAVVGLYGMLAFQVAQRTREIGVRMVVGAKPADIFRSVLSEGVQVAGGGVVVGIAGAVVATRALESLLYGVRPAEPLILAGVSLLLLLTVLAACYLPARAATRVEPVKALRCD